MRSNEQSETHQLVPILLRLRLRAEQRPLGSRFTAKFGGCVSRSGARAKLRPCIAISGPTRHAGGSAARGRHATRSRTANDSGSRYSVRCRQSEPQPGRRSIGFASAKPGSRGHISGKRSNARTRPGADYTALGTLGLGVFFGQHREDPSHCAANEQFDN